MKCRSCDSSTEEVIDLGEQRIPFAEDEEKYPLVLVKCESCHLVQLKDTVPPEKMYTDLYGYRSGVNETIKADLKDIVEKGLELVPNALEVIDIGANDGTLLKNYPEHIKKVAYEPVQKFHKELLQVAHPVYGYFKNGYPGADIITAISMFYDLADPNEFVRGLKVSLADHGVLIVQQNYLKTMLENTAYDNICHEHVMYYSLGSLITLLNRHGLIVFRVEQNEINGGSIRTYICHKGERDIEQNVWQTLKEEESLTTPEPYEEFSKRVKRTAKELSYDLSVAQKKGKVYAYGASTRGAVIIQFANVAKYIDAVVERNPDKIGGDYFGIPVISETEAQNNPPDYALILPWFHSSISHRVSKQTPSAKILVPLPEVQLLTHSDIYPEEHL